MDFELKTHMTVGVEYSADPFDNKCIEITSVKWRNIEILSALTMMEMDDIYAEIYEQEWDRARMGREDRYDMARDAA